MNSKNEDVVTIDSDVDEKNGSRNEDVVTIDSDVDEKNGDLNEEELKHLEQNKTPKTMAEMMKNHWGDFFEKVEECVNKKIPLTMDQALMECFPADLLIGAKEKSGKVDEFQF